MLAHTGSVAGALLVVPSDVEASSFPTRNERVRSHAAAWGAEFIAIGARGHLGDAAKLGMWTEGLELVNRLRGKSRLRPATAALPVPGVRFATT
jgi:predicted alpha/beta hydrolase family esterase